MQHNTIQCNAIKYITTEHDTIQQNSAGNLEPPEDWPGNQKLFYCILFCHFCHFSNIVKHMMKLTRILVIFTLKKITRFSLAETFEQNY